MSDVEPTTDTEPTGAPDEYGRTFDADGNLVAVNGDDQVKRPADDGPKATERVFDGEGNLIAGVGDPVPDQADVVYVDPEPIGLAADTDPPVADPTISESSVLASGGESPAS